MALDGKFSSIWFVLDAFVVALASWLVARAG
jgi:hypothetical protein